jgi:hypothetical protein
MIRASMIKQLPTTAKLLSMSLIMRHSTAIVVLLIMIRAIISMLLLTIKKPLNSIPMMLLAITT